MEDSSDFPDVRCRDGGVLGGDCCRVCGGVLAACFTDALVSETRKITTDKLVFKICLYLRGASSVGWCRYARIEPRYFNHCNRSVEMIA